MRIAVAVLASCSAAMPRMTLAPGQPVDHTLHRGEIDHFTLHLDAGTVALGSVEQHGLDVAVMTYAPDGRRLAMVDGPTGTVGIERFAIEAKAAGDYRIDIGLSEGDVGTGTYHARVDTIESAADYAQRDAKHAAEVRDFWHGRQSETDAFLAWAKQSAVDVDAIPELVRGARVVGFGESDHFVHEYLAARNTMFEQLVLHAGFTVYVGETGAVEATAVDDFITGKSAGNALDVAAGVFSWSAKPFAENVQLVQWMRAYNEHTTRKLHFYGMDMSGGENGTFAHSRLAIDAALAFLDAADPAEAKTQRAVLAPFLAMFTTAGYHAMSAARRKDLTVAISSLETDFDSHRALLVARSSPDAFERARRAAHDASQLEAYFRDTFVPTHAGELPDPNERGVRDAAMADNLAWIVDHDGGRAFVYAHAQHIRRGARIAWPGWPDLVSVGEHAAERWGNDYVAIGSVHGDGPDTPTFDALLARIERPQLLVDLRAAPTTVTRDWQFRADFLADYGQPPFWTAIPRTCFDAIVYVARSTSIPN